MILPVVILFVSILKCFYSLSSYICFFSIGHALKPESSSVISALADQLKKIYVTQIKGYDVHKMCVVTLLFEGNKAVGII